MMLASNVGVPLLKAAFDEQSLKILRYFFNYCNFYCLGAANYRLAISLD